MSDLSMGLSVMKHEQEYMEVRERLHRMSKRICMQWRFLHDMHHKLLTQRALFVLEAIQKRAC